MAAASAMALALAVPELSRAQTPPNVIFIVQDDQNSFSSACDGYPLVKNGVPFDATPNAKRLRDMGVAFLNAFAQTPYCSSSRTSFLFGLQPNITGVYRQGMDWPIKSTISPATLGETPPQKSIIRYFKDKGYKTLGTGKVFHRGWTSNAGVKSKKKADPGGWTHFENCANSQCNAPEHKGKEDFLTWSVGPDFEETGDYRRAVWCRDYVLNVEHDQPFFLAFGISNPHLPWDAAQQFYDDLPPAEEIPWPEGVLPADRRRDVTFETSEDLQDEPVAAVEGMLRGQESYRDSFGKNGIYINGKNKEAVRAYLAEMRAGDAALGIILDNIPPNTLVVFTSDHGWMLGEKLGWRKFTLWDTALRVPLVFAWEGVLPEGQVCHNPVGLIDIYPTLCDLVFGAVPTRAEVGRFPLGGKSRKGMLFNPTAYEYSVVHSQWSLSTRFKDALGLNPADAHLRIRDNNFALILYDGGGTAMYAHSGSGDDPIEQFNLLGPRRRAEHEAIADNLAKLFPDKTRFAPPARDDSEPDDDE